MMMSGAMTTVIETLQRSGGFGIQILLSIYEYIYIYISRIKPAAQNSL